MKVLCVIPARGGSKGIPGKNKAMLAGKPLIQYTLDVALASQAFEQIIVSTDDEEIIQLCSSQPVTVSRRPMQLALDTTPVTEVVDQLLKEVGTSSQAIMLLQPTAPLRETFHIHAAIDALADESVNSVISVCKMQDVHPARMYRIENSRLKSFIPEFEQVRRQDIPPAYYRNGSIYLVRTEAFLKHQSVMVKPSSPLEMDEKYLCNIDDPRDMIVAEALIKAWKENRI